MSTNETSSRDGGGWEQRGVNSEGLHALKRSVVWSVLGILQRGHVIHVLDHVILRVTTRMTNDKCGVSHQVMVM